MKVYGPVMWKTPLGATRNRRIYIMKFCDPGDQLSSVEISRAALKGLQVLNGNQTVYLSSGDASGCGWHLIRQKVAGARVFDIKIDVVRRLLVRNEEESFDFNLISRKFNAVLGILRIF